MDEERKIRREIANSNERRRMQSINAGFHNLRNLLPHHQGEKLSKAAILQQTSEYIFSLEQEKTRLLSQNCNLKRLLSEAQRELERVSHDPQRKARKRVLKSSNSDNNDMANDNIDSNSENCKQEETQQPIIKGENAGDTADQDETDARLGKENTTVKQSPSGVTPQSLPQSATVTRVTVSESSLGAPCKIVQTSHAHRSSPGSLSNVRIQLQPQQLLQTAEIIKSEATTATLTAALSAAGRTSDGHGGPSCKRSYIVTGPASKQNLNSIVEAIKHLEGDQLFANQQRVAQKVITDEGGVVSVAGVSQQQGEGRRRTDKAPAFIIVKKIDT